MTYALISSPVAVVALSSRRVDRERVNENFCGVWTRASGVREPLAISRSRSLPPGV